jgi:hypothetical protein
MQIWMQLDVSSKRFGMEVGLNGDGGGGMSRAVESLSAAAVWTPPKLNPDRRAAHAIVTSTYIPLELLNSSERLFYAATHQSNRILDAYLDTLL